MNNPVNTVISRNLTIQDRPRMALFSVIVMAILFYEILWALLSILLSPPLNFGLFGYSDTLNEYIIKDPMIYAVVFLAGLSLIYKGRNSLGSRRKFNLAGVMLLLGSVVYPLSEYFSPLSLFVILTLESAGLSVAEVTSIYNIILIGFFFLLTIIPMAVASTEIFLKRDRKIVGISIFVYALSIVIRVLLLYMPSSLSSSLINFLGSIFRYELVVGTLPEYLEILSLIILLVAFIRNQLVVIKETRSQNSPQTGP